MRPLAHRRPVLAIVAGLAVLAATAPLTPGGATAPARASATGAAAPPSALVASGPTTKIKHVVVLFGENISYDHYFGTYPQATNRNGVKFHPRKGTPRNENLRTAGLLHDNPNLDDPKRLKPSQAITCDQDHHYLAEQRAYHGGLMDRFVEETSQDTCGGGAYQTRGLTMDYYDGNTVTALWNYAQHFSMSDHAFGDTFGPSTPGALNLVAGQTHGIYSVDPATGAPTDTPADFVTSPDGDGIGTVIEDPDPAWDDCSKAVAGYDSSLGAMDGTNVGELLSANNVSWGWFQGGFKATTPYAGGTTKAKCEASHKNIGGVVQGDYSPHHDPFQYYESTSNPHHLEPRRLGEVGHDGRANHNYDLSWFTKALKGGKLPSVSYLKAAKYQDGHAGYSDPIDEQHFYVQYINAIMRSQYWKDTAIVIAYDDSDGWYDHFPAPVTNGSNDPAEDAAWCASSGAPVLLGYQDRCGPGMRQPMLVISPYAKRNYVSHRVVTQSSITSFIEQNWSLGHLGGGSFDADAASLTNMFDFRASAPRAKPLILRPNGTVVR
ncbi:phospholipase C [Nocardioides sp. MH1]|uniref:phospholipase C n=1 Tax=Nocardioides sp. MH1 TaxID=3242490 RepID=UPI003522B2B1